MKTPSQELREIEVELRSFVQQFEREENTGALDAIESAANKVGRSASGSWIGYHSTVYYQDFKPPPPHLHFSPDWGLESPPFQIPGMTTGDWVPYSREAITSQIFKFANLVNSPILGELHKLAEKGAKLIKDRKDEIISILEVTNTSRKDPFIGRLLDEAKSVALLTKEDLIKQNAPKGEQSTRDALAGSQGAWVPLHVEFFCESLALRVPANCCELLADTARKAASHLERLVDKEVREGRIGTNVFIAHGNSSLWRELKDFIHDRLALPWDEFNRLPVAGITNITRLSEMLDAAAIALIVMTAEDETTEGKLQARMNVIHEAGLFQGRLGFAKAIILLEDGCEEFSNIYGYGQIRFPKGNIKAAFEEVRQVLEREKLIE